MESYEIARGLKDKDHDIIRIKCKHPVASQVQYMPRKAGTGRVTFREPESASDNLINRSTRAAGVDDLLRNKDINGALKKWCTVAECSLKKIPTH